MFVDAITFFPGLATNKGDKDMGAIVCQECRLGYSDESPTDRRLHRKVHDEAIHGIPGPIRRGDQVIWSIAGRHVTVVRHRTATNHQRALAERVAQLARMDTDFDFAAYHASDSVDARNVHVFLMHETDRIVGFLVLERRDFTRGLTWSEWDDPLAPGPRSPLSRGIEMWSIGMVWVHAKYRRKGLATHLIRNAATFLGLKVHDIGWYTPFTDSSELLARKLCPSHFSIAK